jgi:hypothetical protein
MVRWSPWNHLLWQLGQAMVNASARDRSSSHGRNRKRRNRNGIQHITIYLAVSKWPRLSKMSKLNTNYYLKTPFWFYYCTKIARKNWWTPNNKFMAILYLHFSNFWTDIFWIKATEVFSIIGKKISSIYQVVIFGSEDDCSAIEIYYRSIKIW